MRDVVQNHLLQVLSYVALEPPTGRGRRRHQQPQARRLRRALPRPTRRTTSGASTRISRRRRGRARLADRDLLCDAPGDRQLALVRRAVLHPRREVAPGHRDRGACRVQHDAVARVRSERLSSTGGEPARLARRAAPRCAPAHADEAPRGDGPPLGSARHGVRERSEERGRRRTRSCSTRRSAATRATSRARTPSRRRGGSSSRSSTRRRPSRSTSPGPGAPSRRTELTRDYGGWRDPWLPEPSAGS